MRLDHLAPMKLVLAVSAWISDVSECYRLHRRTLHCPRPQIASRITELYGCVSIIHTENLLESVLFVVYSNVEAQCSCITKLSVKIFLFNRFYGKNSSYVHGGLDSNGKPADAVYGQSVST